MGRTTGRTVSLLLALCCLPACAATGGNRFYPGVPRPQGQVALVITAPNTCSIEYLRNEGATEAMKLPSVHWLEILPGQYIASIAYRAIETNLLLQTRRTTGKLVALEMDLKPGSVYVIYPEIGATTHKVVISGTTLNVGSWHPVLVNIKDYQKSACSSGIGQGWFSDCPNREALESQAASYFESDRPVMEYLPGPRASPTSIAIASLKDVSESPQSRAEAAIALRQRTEDVDEVVRAFSDVICDESTPPPLYVVVVSMLGKIGQPAKSAVPMLIDQIPKAALPSRKAAMRDGRRVTACVGCALHDITGQTFGEDQVAWQKWWSEQEVVDPQRVPRP